MQKEKNEKLTKSKDRVRKHGEVYTPSFIVKQMCDMLQDNNPSEDVFRPETTFLEPTCGNGNFLVEILNRKLDRCKTTGDCFTALESIYAIDLLPDNVAESKQRMLDIFNAHCGFLFMQKAKTILDQRIICGDSLEIMKKLENCQWEDVLCEN